MAGQAHITTQEGFNMQKFGIESSVNFFWQEIYREGNKCYKYEISIDRSIITRHRIILFISQDCLALAILPEVPPIRCTPPLPAISTTPK